MIACDTSLLVAYFQNDKGGDIDRLDAALASGDLKLPPVVLMEMLSSPNATAELRASLEEIELLPVSEGYWRRAGLARAKLRRLGLSAKTADSLIAQSCLDYGLPLLARDTDFRHFAKHCGLKLA
jgi:hypothetical protein